MAKAQITYDEDDLPIFDMALPVTRHVLIPEDTNFEYLVSGVDSLDLGLYIDWQTERFSPLIGGLEDLKEKAREKNGLRDQMPDGRKFIHRPNGKPPNYRFHLQYADYQFYIGITNPPVNSPNAYLSLNSKALWHKGFAVPTRQTAEDVESLGGKIHRIQPSRCDLSADFYLPGDPTLEFFKKYMVSRSRKISHYGERDQLETFYAGDPGAEIRMRIYDKGKEILKTGKTWFLNIWGREGPEGVWRVEFQVQRAALKKWGIETLDDLTEKLGGLWRYLTTDWFSLRFEDNTKQERRTVLPWWQAVQEQPDGFGIIKEIIKPEKDNSLAALDWYVTHIGGCLPSYAAKKGAKNIIEAVNELQNDMLAYWFERNFKDELEKRILRLGNEIELEDEDDEERNEMPQPQMHLFGKENSVSLHQRTGREMAVRPFERGQNNQTRQHETPVFGRR